MTRDKAILELVLAGMLWGFGFIATVWGLSAFTPIQFLFLRFAIAWLFGEIFDQLHFSKALQSSWLNEFKWGFPAGLLLGGVVILQTMGLQFTTATQSGFITTLYVILVPLFLHFFAHKKQEARVFLYAGAALFGTYWLTGGNLALMNKGDLLTLLCSIFAAFHIIYIGVVIARSQSAFRFNNMQSLAIVMMTAIPLIIEGKPFPWPQDLLPWLGIFITAFGSTLIAFTIQMRAQKVLSPSTASMLFLLESPFAFLFGFVFLAERLTLQQAAGALIILISSFLTVRAEKI